MHYTLVLFSFFLPFCNIHLVTLHTPPSYRSSVHFLQLSILFIHILNVLKALICTCTLLSTFKTFVFSYTHHLFAKFQSFIFFFRLLIHSSKKLFTSSRPIIWSVPSSNCDYCHSLDLLQFDISFHCLFPHNFN